MVYDGSREDADAEKSAGKGSHGMDVDRSVLSPMFTTTTSTMAEKGEKSDILGVNDTLGMNDKKGDTLGVNDDKELVKDKKMDDDNTRSDFSDDDSNNTSIPGDDSSRLNGSFKASGLGDGSSGFR